MENNHFDDLYLAKVLSGDNDAFRYFVNSYQTMAISIAISMVKQEADAKEVVQNAFIQAFKSLKSYKRESKFSTWLYRIVVNESLKYIRKNKRVNQAVDLEENHTVHLNIVNEAIVKMDLKDKKQAINRVLLLMKPKERLILELYYLKEFSLAEIEEITRFSPSNIKVLLHRGRKNFANYFSNDEKEN